MNKIEVIKNMIEQNFSNGSLWYLLGIEYKEQEMDSEALRAFSEALKYCDKELENKIYSELGNISYKSEKNIYDITISKEKDDKDILQSSEVVDNVISLNIIEGGHKTKVSDEKDDGLSDVYFSDVGGLENLKNIIRMKIIEPFTNPGLFQRFRKKIGGGILLFGPPGCGKTYIAMATAGECNAKFIPVHITDILDPYLGVSAQNIKDIFSSARAKKPCILFFDEVDTIGYNRSKLSSEHMRPIIDQLLSEIEGIDTSTDKMLIIGATNMPWDVDSAFKRPGRFDKIIFVPPPDIKARGKIFELKLKERPVEEINYEVLAKLTELYSGADIDNVVEVATENVINEILLSGIERNITMEDLVKAIQSTKPSTIDWLRTIKNYVKYANQSGLYDDVDSFISKYKKLLG
ncbi:MULTISPECIES: ATP-binding protein [Clostridium]|uniref:ATP-binding protein n=1 Tax=Clostridium butyricum TaxID=1492 RepID=A0AAP9UEX2_CLOBU|nr:MULTISPECIES: ATP-binding protein [Clostridium]EMU55340.1 AAA ATPase [Clostridium butyricum DKU-01]MBZ0314323.1 ATP-binding protein [Clostridium butyricum]MBZ5746750.1 ATP-binding protein [Clostridium butyricum]MDI9208266.1 ATP-binding protein [Clostridium butyricum]MDU4589559.1 ATP-binding protein [Clostridium sp.]